MAGVTISVDDTEIRQALGQLLSRVTDPTPAFRSLGESLLNSARERFRQEVGPDGQRWRENSDVTLLRYLKRRGGLSKKKLPSGGRNLTQKGARLPGSKKILQDRGDLAGTLRYQVDLSALSLGTSLKYGAMQQFGGTKAKFPHLWGDIPAHPRAPSWASQPPIGVPSWLFFVAI